MKGFVSVTDSDWFTFLSQQPEIDEANFQQQGLYHNSIERNPIIHA
jgi:hypothetical protein